MVYWFERGGFIYRKNLRKLNAIGKPMSAREKFPRKLNAIGGWGREGTGKELRGRQAFSLALPPFP